MSVRIFATSYVVPSGPAADLLDLQSCYVAAGATVGAEDGTGINSYTGNNRVDIYGNVIGTTLGINLGINATASHNHTLFLHSGGQIFGYENTAVRMEGYSETLTNQGYIYGGVAGVTFNDFGGTGASFLTNRGTIEGGSYGIAHSSLGSSVTLTVLNSGTITSGGTSYYSSTGAGLIDKIINTGTMIGEITLGDGTDLYDGHLGHHRTGIINGEGGADTIYGGAEADTIFGAAGNDRLAGYGGNDYFRGHDGADLMTGGLGADTFDLRTKFDSGTTVTTEDCITDFSHAQGDKISLSAIDAKTGGLSNDAFKFIGGAAFTHVQGQLHSVISGGNTYVSGDIDGNGVADFTIRLDHALTLVTADFFL